MTFDCETFKIQYDYVCVYITHDYNNSARV